MHHGGLSSNSRAFNLFGSCLWELPNADTQEQGDAESLTFLKKKSK